MAKHRANSAPVFVGAPSCDPPTEAKPTPDLRLIYGRIRRWSTFIGKKFVKIWHFLFRTRGAHKSTSMI
jgi:hypothetical protein